MPVTDAGRPRLDVRPVCAHCGLDVLRGRVAADGISFCCAGCETAWHLLHDAGLDAYYRLPERRAGPIAPSARSFDAFDHPAFERAHVTRNAGLASVELYLEGIHCASCVWLVERTTHLVPGVASAELDTGRGRVRLRWDPARVPLSAIARTLDRLGYRPHPARGLKAEARRRSEDRAMLARIGIAGALAGNVMMIALALYSGEATGMDNGTRTFFRWVSLALSAPAILGPGGVFFRGAIGALRARTLHMDLPIALALLAGFVRGTVNTIRDAGPVYFDGLTALVFLLLVGRFLQQRAQRAAADATELFTALAPTTARKIVGDDRIETPAEALLPGEQVEVRAGDTVPVDGVVVGGHSDLDVSLLTGEMRPRVVGPGDAVNAGTVNRVSTLQVRVERTGEETRIGRLAREVEASAARRAPLVLTADRIAGAFIGVVLALAAVTFVLWSRWDSTRAADQAIAMLIVTCPCALALATPLALTAAIGRAARTGILIKGGDALERLARPGMMVLDKTGTLTCGRLSLVAWDGPAEIRPLVLALESEATHPVARAFAEAWPGLAPPRADAVRHVAGGGLEGQVAGRHVLVGAPEFVAARTGGRVPRGVPGDGLTPVWVAVDGRVVGCARFGDAIRPETPVVLARLRALGWKLAMLSGDDPDAVDRVGERLGFGPDERRGGVTPEEKLAEIEALESRRRVVMVGDGVNDAGAIARASVGVSVRGGAEASLAAADIYLSRPGLEPLARLIDGSHRTLGVIRRTIVVSLLYNAVGATLAMAGIVSPLLAAILMPVSSLTAVLMCGLGRTFQEPAR